MKSSARAGDFRCLGRTVGILRYIISFYAENGQDALIVKAADILDSFNYYTAEQNADQLQYCLRNAKAIFQYKPDEFKDKVFDEIKAWMEKSE